MDTSKVKVDEKEKLRKVAEDLAKARAPGPPAPAKREGAKKPGS